MKVCSRSIALLGGAALLTAGAWGQVPKDHLALGGNVNERFHWATAPVLQQTHATWLRGFIPASEFISGERSYDRDEGLTALRAAAASGHKIVLSIKWDSTGKGGFGPMPAPNSAQEAKAFAFIDHLLDATSGQVAVLVVVNELAIDTLPADLAPDASGQVPVITFLQRLTHHVAAERRKAADGEALPIFAGGMTRLDKADTQRTPATTAMIRWVNEDAAVAGCDFHLHEPDMQTSEAALAFMHRAVPAKPLMITEFSLVWKWQRHLGDALAANADGVNFAKTYNVPPGSTVAQFIASAFEHPVPEAEWQAFLLSQPWFEPHYLSDVAERMQRNGVRIATYGLTWNPKPVSHSVSMTGTPWYLNQLLVPGMAVSPNRARLAENAGFFADFVQYQR